MMLVAAPAVSVSSLPDQEQDLLRTARALCDSGLYLQAHPLLPALLKQTGVEGQLLAARLQGHLGAGRSSAARVVRLWRRHRCEPAVMATYLRQLASDRGAYRAWRFIQDHPFPASAPRHDAADWHSALAYVYGLLRDFETANHHFLQALALSPEEPWPHVEWSYVCQMQDQYPAAADSARIALTKRAHYRPAIQALAQVLTLTGSDDEALQTLAAANAKAESASLAGQVFELLFERGQYTEARAALDQWEQYAPLADKRALVWLNARRADVALRLGELEQARVHAQAAGGPFYERMAQRLAEPEATARRVMLPVGFVRQNHMTCAPATLTALARYWGESVDHLALAEEICYDGTPNHSERKWAESQGYIATEFSVDWNVARSLIDAGVPFTLATVFTGSGHLQAVIGYDELRGTLLIRDPFERSHGEFDADSLFEAHRSSGPRGMLLLPACEAARIAGIVLPDAVARAAYHRLMRALQDHDREAAVAAASELKVQAPDSPWSIYARRSLAMYDGDEAAILDATEALLSLFPGDVNLQLSKAASYSLLRTRDERLAWLQTLVLPHRPDAQVLIRLASLLQEDDRETAQAEKLLRMALSWAPRNAAGWYELAALLWRKGARIGALECYRLASCLDETVEDFASTYCRAGIMLRQTETVLSHLQRRHARLGQKSSQPFITLFLQMESLERTEEAFSLLKTYLNERPDDAGLILFAADMYLQRGQAEVAAGLLKEMTVPVKRSAWLRTQAKVLREMGDPESALAHAREAAELEPFNLGLHRQIAVLLMQLRGKEEGLAYLRVLCARFDHHCGLHELLYEFLHAEPLEQSESVLRRMVEINPGNAWALRELAANLARQQRCDEALAATADACRIAPTHSHNYSTLAFVHLRRGDIAAARIQLREALRLSIDNDYALSVSLELCANLEERRQTLDFVRSELERQVTLGDALLSFQQAAQSTLEPAELSAMLRDAQRQRPELWQAFIALGMQLADAGELGEARAVLEEAVQKFSMLPRAWLELARVQALEGARSAARETLNTTLRLSPGWIEAVRRYVDLAPDEHGSFDAALKAVDRALVTNPESADLYAMRADVLLAMQRSEEALNAARRAIEANPTQYWPWNMLRRIAAARDDVRLVERVAAEVVATRPNDYWCWLRFAQFSDHPEKALEAAEKALEIDPVGQSAHEVRFDLLLRLGRYAALEDALGKLPWVDMVPVSLRVYEARLARARGHTRQARTMLRALLDEDRNNYAFWNEYADWSVQAEDDDAYLEAAQQLVRLAPNHAIAHGYLADALVRSGEKQAALPHFERAFELDPNYAFAGFALVDRALEWEDLDRAQQLIECMTAHRASPELLARSLRLALARQTPELALDCAYRIFSARNESEWASKVALEALDEAGHARQTVERIKAAVETGCCADAALRYLIERQGKGWFANTYRGVRRLLQADPHHLLKRAFLAWLAAEHKTKLLDRFIAHSRRDLESDLLNWAQVGYAYLNQRRYKEAARWLKDWKQRDEVPAWALDNVALALRSVGAHGEARDATLRSLALDPVNHEAQVWLAVDAARELRREELTRLIATIDTDRLRPYFKRLLDIVQHYVDALETGAHARCLARLRTLKAGSTPGSPAQLLISDFSRRLLGQSHWALRPVLWLRLHVV